MSAQSPHLDTLLSKLRPFQRSAFEFAVYGTEDKAAHSKQKRNYSYVGAPTQKQVAGAGTGRILLGDEMGLGKTLTSLAIMLAYQQTEEWPLLILCPASLRYTWPAEIEKFCPWISSQSIHVVRGKDDVHFARQIHRWREKQYKSKKDGTEQQTIKKCPIQIVIVTYSLLQTRYQIANTLRDCEFECIIADESHNLKQGSSQRCQLALPLLQSSKRLVLLSGTPALNRPVELWPQLNALDSKGLMFGDIGKRMTYTEYTKRFCNARRTRFGWDVKGVSNARELHKCLKTVMMRRLKSDVLQDLPAKQRSIVPVTISDKDKERESRDTLSQLGQARQAVSEITDFDADDVANSANWEARKLLMQAYQASGIAKAPSTTEYIIDWLEGSDSTQKLVVFAHHKEVLDYIETTISKRYKGKLGMMRIDGSVPPAERAQRVKKFQTNKHVRLSLLSMTAAGVGLTLTAASNIVFAELHWTPGVLAQAEDRCHRIGQANSVNVMYCICKDEDVSVDMTLWNMLSRKVGNLGAVVDGERAKLNAVEQEISSKKSESSNGNGASVEEELTTFFASSKISSARKQKKGGPVVKGSIQSFFSKVKTTKKPPSVGKNKISTTSKSAECISLLDDDTDRKLPTPSVSATISLLEDEDDDNVQARKKPPNKQASPAVFVCHVCTFENEADVTTCTMCNTPRPTSDREGESADWSCTKCTYLNNSSATHCDMCQEAKPIKSPLEKDYSSNNINDCKPQSSKRVRDEYDFDDEEDWTTEDLAAIDAAATQSHTKISQSPIDLSSPINTRKSSNLQLKSCQSDKRIPPDLLSFSVSRNSGRIALHMSGEPLHVNFDISQVLTKESAEQLEEIHLQRKANNSTTLFGNNILFDDTAVEQVLAVLDDSSMLPPSVSYQDSVHRMCMELKQFVRHYLGLREVEKKAVKESGKAISPSTLKQTAASLVVSTISGSKDRYEGGAKERAITNQLNNCATKEDMAVLNGQACVWCGGPFLCSNGAHYCSYKCAETGRLRRGGMYSSTRIREQLFALEKGVCQMCGVDAHALFVKLQALQPAERLNCLLNAKWKLPRKCKSTDRLLGDPQEHDLWQADHKVAVAEGGGGSGLDNLRTLCTPCHAHETEQLFARLKTLQSEESKDGRTQMDIFSGLSNMSSSSINKKKRKRRRMAD